MAAQEVTAQTGTVRLKKFLREVKAELKKVSWPNKQELAANTGVVFISVVLVAVVIWVVDTVLTEALKVLIK
ncbi:MAG TPA: preprotein translocase subunit SecE [Patescibacteria group bacterium]|nr:preprotein translocase subunit SecE [Patescibacteria group bacterium]